MHYGLGRQGGLVFEETLATMLAALVLRVSGDVGSGTRGLGTGRGGDVVGRW